MLVLEVEPTNLEDHENGHLQQNFIVLGCPWYLVIRL